MSNLSSFLGGSTPKVATFTSSNSSYALPSNVSWAYALLVGGGAGAAPSTITTGNGVVTTLGTSINTAGGFISQSGTLASGALLQGNGSGSAISSITTGTGVQPFQVIIPGEGILAYNGIYVSLSNISSVSICYG